MPVYYRSGCEGRWNQVSPDDILYVEQEGEGLDGGDPTHFYSMINGIVISGERIDLMPPTKTLLKRKHIRDLRHKIVQ